MVSESSRVLIEDRGAAGGCSRSITGNGLVEMAGQCGSQIQEVYRGNLGVGAHQ